MSTRILASSGARQSTQELDMVADHGLPTRARPQNEQVMRRGAHMPSVSVANALSRPARARGQPASRGRLHAELGATYAREVATHDLAHGV